MKIYKKITVFDAALERMRYLFSEFPEVVVAFSGGKDSTVTLQLALQVAEECGRLPLKVAFIDQEAEWQSTIDYVRQIMSDPRVRPYWFQMPLRIFNSTSTVTPWLNCWEEGATWIREREPGAITQNRYGTERFADLFREIMRVEWPGKACYLAGVRAEESPARFIGLTSKATYKAITFGKVLDKKREHFTFYPLYDWSYTDIWKAIHDNGWPYCKLYDHMFQYGVQPWHMRVSNVHHETAVRSLFYLQEIEGDTWNRITARVGGINTAGQMRSDAFFIGELPEAFGDWKEYRDYLCEHLIVDTDAKARFLSRFAAMDKQYAGIAYCEGMYRAQINSILCNDWHFTKLENWERTPEVNSWRKFQIGEFHPLNVKNRYIGMGDAQSDQTGIRQGKRQGRLSQRLANLDKPQSIAEQLAARGPGEVGAPRKGRAKRVQSE